MLSIWELIILVALVGGIAALCHKRTRRLGYVILSFPVVLLALVAFRMFGFAALGGAGRASRVMLGMPVVMLLVVGGIAALVALLSNRRTRPVGYVLLAVPVVLAGLAGAWLFYYNAEYRQSRPIAHGNTISWSQPPVEVLAVAPEREEQKETPKTTPLPVKPKRAVDTPKTTESIVRALITAFGQTLGELKGLPAKENNPAAAKKAAAAKEAPQAKPSDSKDKNTDAENSAADRISQMVEVLSSAVEQELPDDVEVDQFTALRALGKLLGRIIASEQDTQKTVVVAKPASGLNTKKTSAVAEPAAVAGESNAKRPASTRQKTKPKPADKTSKSDNPAWADAPAQRVGDSYQIVFVVGPYTTRLECDQAMPAQLNRSVADYAELYLDDERARRATLPASFLRDHVIKDQWEEIFESSVGEMVRVHTRLLFDGRTNTELKASLRRAIIAERLWIAGGGLAAVLMVISGLFGALKFDHITGGSYRGRMKFILLFVGMAVILWVWVPWGRWFR